MTKFGSLYPDLSTTTENLPPSYGPAQMKRHFSAEHPESLSKLLLARTRRVLLVGPPGIGKSTLVKALAGSLHKAGRPVHCLAADPGMPAFGIPGAVNLGLWKQDAWEVVGRAAVCSLDAARFRLPLIEAAGDLASQVEGGTLLLDTPGVVRGVAGAELLISLAHRADVDLVMVLMREGQPLHLSQELQSLAAEVVAVEASASASRPGKGIRDRQRTRHWDDYLSHASEVEIDLSEVAILGTPPRQATEAWVGKQVAFLDGSLTVGMGEVVDMGEERLRILLPPDNRRTGVILVRDAVRDESGLLVTGKRFAESVVRYLPPSDLVPDDKLPQNTGPRPMVQTPSATAVLMNGVFGDPQLHLRLAHQRRSLLFDLGDGARLPARIAHQVSDVFISHTHMDHICGFLWLLRSRIGESERCRLYGPPGLATQIEHLINGIHWDRIADRGPRFEIAELHGEQLIRYNLQAGSAGIRPDGETVIENGIVLDEPGFRVRAVTLEHGIPVIAYAFEPVPQINVLEERLSERGLQPGPWLTRLKQLLIEQRLDESLSLPDGTSETIGALAAALTLTTPGSKIVYATDLADTPHNRDRLTQLAGQAHTLFCESPFMQKDAAQARRTGHLTTTACAEIANSAAVRHLIPFHFSRRYEGTSWQVYNEIAADCPHVVIPATSDSASRE
ncbi:MAG: Clp1/GlmU family protein [Candidatus Thiodiazotropha endolucinida]